MTVTLGFVDPILSDDVVVPLVEAKLICVTVAVKQQ
jgi:hypothetical protein